MPPSTNAELTVGVCSWNGLSSDDNYQALAIAKVMKKFTSEGIEVWLRFAHEGESKLGDDVAPALIFAPLAVNWYQSDGTYSGGVEEFKTAWKAVAEAVKDDPLVFMFVSPPPGSRRISSRSRRLAQFTPNIAASLDDYTRYFPDDVSSVHYIG